MFKFCHRHNKMRFGICYGVAPTQHLDNKILCSWLYLGLWYTTTPFTFNESKAKVWLIAPTLETPMQNPIVPQMATYFRGGWKGITRPLI